jgi:glycosyltransferase involved in cell wall biosynthesis
MSQLITVGLPVFNAMPHLPETVESLLSQTYKDFTLLVINDGSSDGSLDYLKSVKDKRVKVISQQNAGLSTTLNRMLELSSTPWLVRQDADDIAYPRRLEQTIEFIRLYPNAGMFYSDADYYPMKKGLGKFRTTQGSPEKLRKMTEEGYLLAICHPSVTLNVEKTLAVGGYRFNLYVEDVDLWWRMALVYDIRFIPEITVGVRQNRMSSSWQNLERQAVNTFYIQYLLVSHLSNLTPRCYEDVYPVLRNLLDPRKFRLRHHLRSANMHLSNARLMQGLVSISRAFLSSPVAFGKRIQYGLFPHPDVANGDSPKELWKKSKELWQEGELATNDRDS